MVVRVLWSSNVWKMDSRPVVEQVSRVYVKTMFSGSSSSPFIDDDLGLVGCSMLSNRSTLGERPKHTSP